MRRILTFSLLIAVALAFGSGCFSYSTLHTAKPVEQGKTEMTLAPGYFGGGVSNEASGDIPTAEFAARHGLTPDLDVGAKVFPVGVAFDANYAFINTPDFAVSANPYVSVTRLSSGTGSVTWGFALLNILADVVSTDMATVTVGAKPGFLYGFGSGDTAGSSTGAWMGGMAGVKLHLTDTFALMPNFDIMTPIDGFGDTFLYNFGVAVSY
ncbi:MAG: hypothetical protein ACLFVJ_22590 [Persicimonas sp.]